MFLQNTITWCRSFCNKNCMKKTNQKFTKHKKVPKLTQGFLKNVTSQNYRKLR